MKSTLARIATALGLSIACCTTPAVATTSVVGTDDAALGRQGSNFIEFWFGTRDRRGGGSGLSASGTAAPARSFPAGSPP